MLLRFLILSFCALLFSAPAQSQIVTVSSVYKEGAKRTRVQGTGFVVRVGKKQFVFTASHVSQGEPKSLLIIDEKKTKLKLLSRTLSQEDDVEMFEVVGAPAGFELDLGSNVIRAKNMPTGRKRWIDSFNFILIPSWVQDPHLDYDNTYNQQMTNQVFSDPMELQLHAPVPVQAGSSGAPLLSVVPDLDSWPHAYAPYDENENYIPSYVPDERKYVSRSFAGYHAGEVIVRGLALSRDRFFARSRYARTISLVEMLTKYLKKERNFDDESRWIIAGGALIREDAKNNIQESSVVASVTAGPLVQEQGNGVGVESGDSVLLFEDSPEKALSSASAVPIVQKKPVTFWKFNYFHSSNGKNPLRDFWWFDWRLYACANWASDDWSTPIEEKVDLVRTLKQRFNMTFVSQPYLGFKTAEVSIEDQVAVNLPTASDDVLKLRFNKNGELCADPSHCATGGFKPVVEVRSEKEYTPYLVDLRGFFFANPLDFDDLGHRRRFENYEDVDVMPSRTKEMYFALSTPRIYFRKKAMVNRALTTPELLGTRVEWHEDLNEERRYDQ